MTDFATDDARYEAVRLRDRTADGVFFYSVASTGIYCRPGCAARLADRRNIAFHDTCQAAEAAGFRACKRCRPNADSQQERHVTVVKDACRLIEAAETPLSLEELADAAGISAFHFHRVFKQVTGVTPKAYASAKRAERLATHVSREPSITDAVYAAGFAAPSRFYEQANARLGMTPTSYRRGGENARIRFAIGDCTLGVILVAATDKGVCAILLGDDPQIVLRDLQKRFPRAELLGGEPAFETMVAQVVGLVETPGSALNLPLDIGGTAFQQKVWQALRAIPAGQTATYAQLANAIGQPSAVRAVAGACAANPIAVAIPCHRVIRTDGDLSGYRWGVERKRTLLEREGRS